MSQLLKDRVAAGVIWLDMTKPGWRKKINVDELDVSDGQKCPVGQVFGDYDRTVEVLVGHNETLPWGVDFGFVANSSVRPKPDEALYYNEDLNAEWRRVLALAA